MSRSAQPQALLSPITEAAIFLTVVLEEGQEDGVPDLLSEVTGLKRSVGFRLPEGELSCVVGIGARTWDRLFGEPRPAKLHPFGSSPATGTGPPRRPGTCSSTSAPIGWTSASSSRSG